MATATLPHVSAEVRLPVRLRDIKAEATVDDIPANAVRAPDIDASSGMSIGVLADNAYFEYPYVHSDDQGFGYYDEVRLTMTPAAADLSRLRAGVVPVLMHHDSYEQVGAVVAAWISVGKLMIAWVYSSSPYAQQKRKDVRSGIIRGLSVGAAPTEVRVDRRPSQGVKGRLTFPAWRLNEATLTPMPANPRAVVVSASLAPVTATSGGLTPSVTLPDERLSLAATIVGAIEAELQRRQGGKPADDEASLRRARHLEASRGAHIAPGAHEENAGWAVRVPLALLEAATTTTATAVGLQQEVSPLADVFARAAGPARLLGILPRRPLRQGRLNFPRVRLGPLPNANLEGQFTADQIIGAVGASINAAAVALTLDANATSTVAVGDYLKINDEIVRVTAVTSQQAFTVARGQVTTAGAAHNASAVVFLLRSHYAIDSVATGVKRFAIEFKTTAEAAVGYGGQPAAMDDMEGMLTALVEADFLPFLAAKMNEDLWQADGTANKVKGMASLVDADHTSTYAAAVTAQALLDAMYEMVFAADDADVPENRVFMVSPRFYRKLLVTELATTKDLVVYDAMGRPSIWGIQIVKDTDISESATATDFGRCWLLAVPWLRMVDYDGPGADPEFIFDRENQTGNWILTVIRLWDFVAAYDDAIRLLKEA